MRTHIIASFIAVAALFSGCGGTAHSPTPQFEIRDFVVSEKKEAATEYSKAWNSFTGTGTIVARNVDKDRNLIVVLEIRDATKGPSSEPDIGSILVQGGIGKIEIKKSTYDEMSPPPKYSWKVIGWYELQKATIEAPGQSAK
jgi:hypothetical protein